MKKTRTIALTVVFCITLISVVQAINIKKAPIDDPGKFDKYRVIEERSSKFKDKEIRIKEKEEKYSQILKDWRKEPQRKLETVTEYVYLNGDENNLELTFQVSKNPKRLSIENEIFDLKINKNIDSFKETSEIIKTNYNDSRIDAYIAFIAEKNDEIDYAYECILEAVSKQPENDLYRKLLKRIYEKRAKLIIENRQKIIESNF